MRPRVNRKTGEIIGYKKWLGIQALRLTLAIVVVTLSFRAGVWGGDLLQAWLYDQGHSVSTWPRCPHGSNPWTVFDDGIC